jgi:hypothetical protein
MVSYEDALAAILEVWIKCYERFEQQVPAFVVCLCIQGGNANPHFGYVGRPLALLGLVKTLRGGAYTHERWPRRMRSCTADEGGRHLRPSPATCIERGPGAIAMAISVLFDAIRCFIDD